MITRNVRWFALALAVSAPLAAHAEEAKFNFHTEAGAGVGLNNPHFVTGGWMNLDTTIFGLGPVAPSLEIYGLGSANRNALSNGSAFGGGLGLRVRILNDEKGYLFPLAGKGNAHGNLWVDAHVNYTSGGLGVGFDVGLGYELSLIEDIQVGPFARLAWLGPQQAILFGLTLSIGFPSAPPSDSDPDSDGIKGADDKCPDEAEDKDGFEDTDGCPDKDDDKDGIEDAADKCPRVAEDKDGFEDTDGCPDGDNDKDGIEDAKDKCPSEPEDKDGFEDGDGCPDKDNDKDGIEDAKDKCPSEPETMNGVEDDDGCPEKEAQVFVTSEKVVITDKVQFDTNKATIKKESDKLLDNVAEVLKKFPAVKKVRIDGHCDDVGDDKANQTLSEKRAKAVYDALVKRGIDKARLDTKGYGRTKPLVEGKDEASREKNRRVEFVITQHD